ncbi:Chemotaxis response regulator protein-glutamate methylesterase [Aquisphaera giovannonii]|uniref:protein-glutamate methylesterase n=2 Tax=Aquisphaera giovannonii TaxID=406548 RepID=A0A5B9W5I1_9BACT|nr:Chemotaxis response regulator protein-glutamate methylesterase [Aquisphaera giovannonii]
MRAVVVGASAGAVEALSTLLPMLPREFPMPILAVVHLPADRESLLPGILKSRCLVDVREAEDKEPTEPGTVYLAPPDYHLLVERDGTLSLSSEEPVLYSRPSIDVLFESAADAYGPGLIGVVLTGANSDGARGLRAIADAGGMGLVQRPDLAYAPAMPQAALDACPGALALTLEEIAAHLMEARLAP